MPNFLKEYQIFLKINRYSSERTIKEYSRDIIKFGQFLNIDLNNEEALKKINNDKIKDWLINIKNYNTNRTISRKIVAIKMYFIFLKEVYNIQNNHILNLNGLKFASTLPKAVQANQIMDIIDKLECIIEYKTKWELLRDKLLLIILFSTGMRISEALKIKKTELLGNYFKICGKSKKERIVPILNIIKEYYIKYQNELENATNVIPQNDFLFIKTNGKVVSAREVEKKFQQIKINKNLQYFSPHIMRHSFATSLLENGANIKQIQELLGHQQLATTQKYTKITQKIIGEKLKRIKW